MAKNIKQQIEEPDGVRKYLIPWGIYIDGARNMLLQLRNHLLLDEPKQGIKRTSEERIINKAIIDLILFSKDNTDRFLTEGYDEIRLTDHKRDKKGKLVSCRAYFARKITSYQEIKSEDKCNSDHTTPSPF